MLANDPLIAKNEMIIKINTIQVERFGGKFAPPHNFLKESSLDYLLEIIDSELFGEPLYPQIHHKAGLYSIVLFVITFFKMETKEQACKLLIFS